MCSHNSIYQIIYLEENVLFIKSFNLTFMFNLSYFHNDILIRIVNSMNIIYGTTGNKGNKINLSECRTPCHKTN